MSLHNSCSVIAKWAFFWHSGVLDWRELYSLECFQRMHLQTSHVFLLFFIAHLPESRILECFYCTHLQQSHAFLYFWCTHLQESRIFQCFQCIHLPVLLVTSSTKIPCFPLLLARAGAQEHAATHALVQNKIWTIHPNSTDTEINFGSPPENDRY